MTPGEPVDFPVFLLIDGPFDGWTTATKEIEEDGVMVDPQLQVTYWPDAVTVKAPDRGSAVYDLQVVED